MYILLQTNILSYCYSEGFIIYITVFIGIEVASQNYFKASKSILF